MVRLAGDDLEVLKIFGIAPGASGVERWQPSRFPAPRESGAFTRAPRSPDHPGLRFRAMGRLTLAKKVIILS